MKNGNSSMGIMSSTRTILTRELSFDRAFELAARLTSIPGFVNRNETIEAMADDLREWCADREVSGEYWDAERQAVCLIREARRRMAKWTGPQDLYAMYLELFAPEKRTSIPASKPIGDPMCPECRGIGFVSKDIIDANGVQISASRPCACRQARRQGQNSR